jgi:DNA-binding transcriptional LysR family regulator
MKIFLEVYQTENITRAARKLHMTQPAVTRAVQEIEKYYGICLFERINKRLSVTESGKRMYAHALHLVDAFETMEKELRNWDSFGVLRLGASVSLGNSLLPELVCSFRQLQPNIKAQVTISNVAGLQKALLENNLDIALIEGNVAEPDLHKELLSNDRLLLILPPRHPLLGPGEIKLKDLTAYDFLLREKGSAGRTLLDDIYSARGMALHPLWESASTQAIVKAVHYGIGISILPEQLVSQDIASGFVSTREIADQTFDREQYLVGIKTNI